MLLSLGQTYQAAWQTSSKHASSNQTGELTPYLIQSIFLLLLALVLFTAAVYMTVDQLWPLLMCANPYMGLNETHRPISRPLHPD